MVTVSLLFSALKFFHDVKDLIYPSLETTETCLTSVKATKWRFFATQTSIFLALFVQVTVIALKDKVKNENMLFGPTELIILVSCELVLYTVQIVVLIFAYNVLINLIKMNRSEPAIEANNEYGQVIIRSIKKRLPRIVCSFAVLLAIQTSFFVLYTIETIIDWVQVN